LQPNSNLSFSPGSYFAITMLYHDSKLEAVHAAELEEWGTPKREPKHWQRPRTLEGTGGRPMLSRGDKR